MIFETSLSKCKTTHQISKTKSYFSSFDLFQNTAHNSPPKTQDLSGSDYQEHFSNQNDSFTRSHTPHMCKH